MPRRSRELSTTGIYHIMLRGNERKKILVDDEDKKCFLEYLKSKRNDMGFSIYSYCFMDNHLHLLIDTKGQELSVIMKGVATRYAYYYNEKHQRVGHVFQDRFKSEPVEGDRYLLSVVRYIHNNPIKAQIVEKAEDYKWSSYRTYLKQYPSEEELVDTPFILDIITNDRKKAIEEFKRFSTEPDEAMFLDYEKEGEIRTIGEGQEYLKAYLKTIKPAIKIEDVKKDLQLRKEVIAYLRANTKLSQRKIAEILGIDKSIVEKIKI